MYYSDFVIPFVIGTIFLFGVIAYKYIYWFLSLTAEQKKLAGKGIFSLQTIHAVWAVIKDALLHISIFKQNTLLGYMHFSLAFGWFLLIVVGSIETAVLIGTGEPLYVHIFFKYFHSENLSTTALIFANVMDFLLLFVLSGVALAWYKRLKKNSMGMRKRTRHILADRVALTSLWFIFPVRLIAESITSGVTGNGGFMTGGLGKLLAHIPNLEQFELPAWWLYSTLLCIFFLAMPFSRYMHIFTEIPHIFLKYWGVKPTLKVNKSDNFQVHACSRCGICIDPCQLQSELNINSVQGVYFLRERRSGNVSKEAIDNCLMCGRCENKCPVGIDINTLRLASRKKMHEENGCEETRYAYFSSINTSKAESNKSAKVGYFAGCMTLLQPAVIHSMSKIFEAAKTDVWFADKDGGVCCGRPLRLIGEVEASQKMVDFNRSLFEKAGVNVIVTSCPICLKTFKEDYNLEQLGIEVMHHSQYIDKLITDGVIVLKNSDELITYHDPCELGRGLSIYDEPRNIIKKAGRLVEAKDNREHSMCCGYSLANNKLLSPDKKVLNSAVMSGFADTGAKRLITACPQCKSAFNANREGIRVQDIAELVSASL